MKILVVSQYFWPEQFRINELVKDLVGDGHEVTVYTGIPNYPGGEIFNDFKASDEKYFNYFGAKVIRSFLFPRKRGAFRLFLNYLSFMISSTINVVKLRRDYDVVFFFQFSPVFSGLAAALYSWWNKKPLVTWVQDLWPESLSATGYIKNRYVEYLVGLFVRFIYDRSDVLLVQSKSFEKAIESRFGSKYSNKIEYFPNWADGAFTNSIAEGRSDFYQKRQGYFDLIFAGNIGAAQDFDTLVEAFEMLKGEKIRLVVFGDGSDKERLESLVKSKGLAQSIIFLGRHPVDSMPPVFSKADGLIVSLRDEFIFSLTIPSKLQAYLTANKPIIASLAGEGAKVVEEAGCGLVSAPGDVAALSDNIRLLSQMGSQKRDEMSKNAKQYYLENFEKDGLRKTLVNVFEKLL